MDALRLRKSVRDFSVKELSDQDLSNLLWAAFGINRPERGQRTAATAFNCQDIEIYVVFDQGAYLYEAKSHSLTPVVKRDLRALAATQQYARTAPVNLVYVSDSSKMPDRVEEKKPIYAAFHAGSISQNVYLYCASSGMGAVVRDSIDRAGLRDALGLSEDQVIVMAQSVGYPSGSPP